MPITPLHFGVLAPVNHFAKGKVNNASFIAVNVWLDGNSILYAIFGVGDFDHSGHTMLIALALSAIVAVFGFRSRSWIYGAFLGGVSHILLDMLVHTDMEPLAPLVSGNPFYMDWMAPLSVALLPLCVWLIVQYVSGILDWIGKARVVETREPRLPSA